jgi:multidrug efflux pump subunit AcrB
MNDADPGELNHWAGLFLDKLKAIPSIADVTTDQLNAAPMLDITVKRDVASSYGILPYTIDNTLDDAFGQRIVSTIYTTLQQYHVILEVNPKFQYGPEALNGIYVTSSSGQQVPISTLVDSVVKVAPLVVNHQGQFPSVTISFNLAPGAVIGDAVNAIQRVEKQLGAPLSVQASIRSLAEEHADPHRRSALRHLPHSRHSLRERDPPDHHHLDPAIGRPRRAVAADGGSP